LNKIVDEGKVYGIINFSHQVIFRNELIQGDKKKLDNVLLRDVCLTYFLTSMNSYI
jgi:hypothetical protein